MAGDNRKASILAASAFTAVAAALVSLLRRRRLVSSAASSAVTILPLLGALDGGFHQSLVVHVLPLELGPCEEALLPLIAELRASSVVGLDAEWQPEGAGERNR
jgi:hypothetical protein